MKITRISKIRNHRVFADFLWPTDLPNFGRFNLIYGWNGSGKTTLSRLLRCIEKRENITEGEVDFHLDGTAQSGLTLSSAASLPAVRVFNRDFMDANFVRSDSAISPIFFLGEDSVEKQKQVEQLAATKASEAEKLDAKNKAKTKAAKALDDFCIAQGKAIRAVLGSSGTNPYNNYDKASFKQTCQRLIKLATPPAVLTDDEKNVLKKQKDGSPKEKISAIALEATDAEALYKGIDELLGRTVVSKTIATLLSKPTVAAWVQEGLSLHAGENKSETCEFCGSRIPESRIAQLEAHFNDEYNQFLQELDTKKNEIAACRNKFADLELPDKARLYDHLASDFAEKKKALKTTEDSMAAFLASLDKALAEKANRLFEKTTIAKLVGDVAIPATDGQTEVAAVNEVIARHNTETDNFTSVVAQARKGLEDALVAEVLEEYKRKSAAIVSIESEITALTAAIKKLEDDIGTLERDIVEHRRPAEQLTSELENYLGRDELKFELAGNGYQLMRHGVLASNLSEGERTAIAFLYFLKTLQDKGFNLATGIIVVDDPVSSLDANSLFCAFGYMKARTKDAGQLFVLTHNFNFFRQVRNWLHKGLRGQDRHEARFYFIESRSLSGRRNASLGKLDYLLREFQSEYQYIFKQVYDEAQKTGGAQPMEEFYHLPNLGRRLLESFFAFRFPQEGGDLYKSLEKCLCDPAVKARLLRFLDSYSHNQTVGDDGHDLSILAETPHIMKDVIRLIETEDKKHFDEMVALLASTGVH